VVIVVEQLGAVGFDALGRLFERFR
jgi:hypothetical protein